MPSLLGFDASPSMRDLGEEEEEEGRCLRLRFHSAPCPMALPDPVLSSPVDFPVPLPELINVLGTHCSCEDIYVREYICIYLLTHMSKYMAKPGSRWFPTTATQISQQRWELMEGMML